MKKPVIRGKNGKKVVMKRRKKRLPYPPHVA